MAAAIAAAESYKRLRPCGSRPDPPGGRPDPRVPRLGERQPAMCRVGNTHDEFTTGICAVLAGRARFSEGSGLNYT
jgi:hypothetical protein